MNQELKDKLHETTLSLIYDFPSSILVEEYDEIWDLFYGDASEKLSEVNRDKELIVITNQLVSNYGDVRPCDLPSPLFKVWQVLNEIVQTDSL